jgi:hypothetical protein
MEKIVPSRFKSRTSRLAQMEKIVPGGSWIDTREV